MSTMMLRVFMATSLVVWFGNVATAAGRAAEKNDDAVILEFTVAGMNCDDCAKTATRLLNKVSGVRQAQVDFETKRARVQAEPKLDREALREALASVGFEAVFAGEILEPPLTAEQRAALDIRVISHGESVDLEKSLPAGKITIVDYYADWCGPCHILSPKLERFLLKYENLALRKVDIRDWHSDAAKQATHKFRLAGLPYVRVYDKDGQFVGAIVGNHADKVEALIERAMKE